MVDSVNVAYMSSELGSETTLQVFEHINVVVQEHKYLPPIARAKLHIARQMLIGALLAGREDAAQIEKYCETSPSSSNQVCENGSHKVMEECLAHMQKMQESNKEINARVDVLNASMRIINAFCVCIQKPEPFTTMIAHAKAPVLALSQEDQ